MKIKKKASSRAKRLAQASRKVRKESLRANREFAAIDHIIETTANSVLRAAKSLR